MSYYSDVVFDLEVKLEKIDIFCKKQKKLEDALDKEWVHHNVSGLFVEADGRLGYEESFRRHYSTDDFAWWLREFVNAGMILYTGEDQERWGYEFDGSGKVFTLEFSVKRGQEVLMPDSAAGGKRE